MAHGPVRTTTWKRSRPPKARASDIYEETGLWVGVRRLISIYTNLACYFNIRMVIDGSWSSHTLIPNIYLVN